MFNAEYVKWVPVGTIVGQKGVVLKRGLLSADKEPPKAIDSSKALKAHHFSHIACCCGVSVGHVAVARLYMC